MGLLYAVDNDRIFSSADGGFTWSFFAAPPSACPSITAFAVEPTKVLIVGTESSAFANLDCGGVFWSADGGRFWDEPLPQVPASDFVIDPEVPPRISACR